MRSRSRSSTLRRPMRCAALVGMVQVCLLVGGVGTAAAKGPMPVSAVPTGSLTVGESTEIEVLLEWPGGEVPLGLNPDVDFWGGELPWQLVAVPVGEPIAATAETVLPLTHDIGLRYTAWFTPATAGEWTLAVVLRRGSGAPPPLASQVVHVGEPSDETPVAAAVGGGAVVLASLIGASSVIWLRRRRA